MKRARSGYSATIAAPRASQRLAALQTGRKRSATLAAIAACSAVAASAAALTPNGVAHTPVTVHTSTSNAELFRLGEDTGGLVRGVVVQRPSARNRSPYVGDVRLPCGRVAIAHMPSMDMGGKCVPGAEVLLRPQVDKGTGQLIGYSRSE